MSRQKKTPASAATGAGTESKTDSPNHLHDTTKMVGMQGLFAPSGWGMAERERRRQRAADWQRAVAKLSVEFEAAQGGGYPEELKGLLPDERLKLLKALGFRVVRRFTIEDEEWADISGKICVNLTDGWVGRSVCG